MKVMLAGLSLSPEVSPMSVPGRVTESKLRFRGYSSGCHLPQSDVRKAEWTGRQVQIQKTGLPVSTGKGDKEAKSSLSTPSSLTSELGCRQLRRITNTATRI